MTLKFNSERTLTIKGWIGGISAMLCIVSYVVYYLFYYKGIQLDELYFISTGISISIFTGLLFTMFTDKWVRTFLLFASVFYFILITIYVFRWMMVGIPYAYIKTSLIIGLIIGLIHFVYDTIITSTRTKN